MTQSSDIAIELAWTSKATWGYTGRVHRTEATVDDAQYKFVVGQIRTGHWVVQGYRDFLAVRGTYREARTLKAAKAAVLGIVRDMRIQAEATETGVTE